MEFTKFGDTQKNGPLEDPGRQIIAREAGRTQEARPAVVPCAGAKVDDRGRDTTPRRCCVHCEMDCDHIAPLRFGRLHVFTEMLMRPCYCCM